MKALKFREIKPFQSQGKNVLFFENQNKVAQLAVAQLMSCHCTELYHFYG